MTEETKESDGAPASVSDSMQLLEQKILAVLNVHLSGIDKTEIEEDDGWWETSTGAEFGATRLALVRAGIRVQILSFLEHMSSNKAHE